MESLLSDCLFWSNWNSWRKLKVGSHSSAVLHNSIFTGDTTKATNTSAMVFEFTIFSITIVFTLKNHCIIGCIKALKRLNILFCKYRNRCGRLRDWCGFKKKKILDEAFLRAGGPTNKKLIWCGLMDFCSRQPSHDKDRIPILREKQRQHTFYNFPFTIIVCLICKTDFYRGRGNYSPCLLWQNQQVALYKMSYSPWWVSDCCNVTLAIFQFYHDENKLHFNEMMSAVYNTNTLSWLFYC